MSKSTNTMICGKKAQMEMIGLVVIVILITLGMLFMAQFALKENPQKKIFTRKGLAYSTVSALMKTTIDNPYCAQQFYGETLPQIGKDLLEDCAINSDTKPDGYSLYRCGGKHSCVFLQEKIEELLEETLGGWNKRYEFTVQLVDLRGVNPENILEPIKVKGGCPRTTARDSSEQFFIHTDAGLVSSLLFLCD